MVSSKIDELLPLPKINLAEAESILVQRLAEKIKNSGKEKAVIGVSGGIDSALTLFLTAKAIGHQNITALLMPYKTSSEASIKDGIEACEKAGVKYIVKELSRAADAYFETEPDITQLRKGNVLARLRMIFLYDASAKNDAIVLGTGNKTEIILGYCTLWGDMASAMTPLGDLYKCHVKALAAYMGVPDTILKKPPSADLWEGQTDEGELQITYDLADRIIYHWVDEKKSAAEIILSLKESGENIDAVNRVISLAVNSNFKRKMPDIVYLKDKNISYEFNQPASL
ncbi:MAG: NAD+ synthase [Spirochaetia bacterium]|nr:NAD+ synthase [Spirochaetia bacterium]